MTINLRNVVDAWKTPEFNDVLKTELEKMSVDELPLQQGLSFSNIALDTSIKIVPLSFAETNHRIIAKVSIFYTGLISGCQCADDPSPIDKQNEHCEVQLDIRKNSGETTVRLLMD